MSFAEREKSRQKDENDQEKRVGDLGKGSQFPGRHLSDEGGDSCDIGDEGRKMI